MKVRIVRDENYCNIVDEKELRKAQTNEFRINYLQRLLEAEVISVQCGALSGHLHRSLFICPGIHENCIEFEGRMISPRRFAIYANLTKQKDWKGSIKFQRKPLRFLFENNLLDFHGHDFLCTGKCISKCQMGAQNSHSINYPLENGHHFGPRDSSTVASTSCVNMPMSGPPIQSGFLHPSMFMMPAAFPTVTQPNRFEIPLMPPLSPMTIYNHFTNSFYQNPAMFWFEAEKTGVLKETIDRLMDSIKELKNLQNPVSNSLMSKVTALFGLQLETVSKVYERVFAAQMAMFPAMPDPSQLPYPFQIPQGPSDHFAPKKEASISPKSTPDMKNPNELLAAMASAMIPSTSQASATIEEQNVAEQPQPKYSPYF